VGTRHVLSIMWDPCVAARTVPTPPTRQPRSLRPSHGRSPPLTEPAFGQFRLHLGSFGCGTFSPLFSAVVIHVQILRRWLFQIMHRLCIRCWKKSCGISGTFLNRNCADGIGSVRGTPPVFGLSIEDLSSLHSESGCRVTCPMMCIRRSWA